MKEANPENFSPIPLFLQILWHFEFFRKPLIFCFRQFSWTEGTFFRFSCSCEHWTVCFLMIYPECFEKLRKPDISVCLGKFYGCPKIWKNAKIQSKKHNFEDFWILKVLFQGNVYFKVSHQWEPESTLGRLYKDI